MTELIALTALAALTKALALTCFLASAIMATIVAYDHWMVSERIVASFSIMVGVAGLVLLVMLLSACTLPLTKRQPTHWVTEHDVLVLVGELDDRMRAAEARMQVYEAADDDLNAELDALHRECAECMEAVR